MILLGSYALGRFGGQADVQIPESVEEEEEPMLIIVSDPTEPQAPLPAEEPKPEEATGSSDFRSVD